MWSWFRKKRSEDSEEEMYVTVEVPDEEPVEEADLNEMTISNEGFSLIQKFEGFRGAAYQDIVGVWTIGYGHTKGVKEGDIITREEAIDLLREELIEYEGYVKEYVKVPLTQSQFDALVSFVYNLGPTNLSRSTLLRKLNVGDYDSVPSELLRWNKAGGKEVGGLTRRRQTEANLFARK